jgi:diguanylate cyclase (GGDEF)-like protein
LYDTEATMNAEMLEKLLDISREMAENRDLDPLLRYAIRVALELCNGEYGYLVLLNEDGTLDFRVKQDRQGAELVKPASQISRTIFEKVIAGRKPKIIADASFDPDYRDAESVISLRLRSVMCIPLISRGAPLGAIYIENRSHRDLFSQEDLKPMEYFAAQAAVAIENAMLNIDLEARVAQRTVELKNAFQELEQRTNELIRINARLEEEIAERKRAQEELRRLAVTDSLTGVYNRRQFFVLGEQAFRESRRYDNALAALMVDADHFKRFNDQYGHAVGDQVLRTLATRLSLHARAADILGRYGGEEFAILMPETSLEEGLKMAERLRQDIEAQPIQAGGKSLSMTISIGVAALDDSLDETIDGLVDRADQALYAAKQAGRNRVSSWSLPGS